MSVELTKEVEKGLSELSEGAVEIGKTITPALEKLVDRIEPAVTKLAATLGTTAEHLWVILVKQSYICAYGNIVIIAGLTFGLCAAWWGAKQWSNNINDNGWDVEGMVGVWCIKGFSTVIYIIAVVSNGVMVMKHLINPEYYALMKILDKIN